MLMHPHLPLRATHHQERIRELLNRSGGVASELFAAGGRAGAEVPGAASRSSTGRSGAAEPVWGWGWPRHAMTCVVQ